MKRCFSLLLAIITLAIIATPAFAAQSEVSRPQPRYIAIDSLAAYISIEGDEAICNGYVAHTGATVNFKLILQRSTDSGKTYTDYSTLLNETYTNSDVSVEETMTRLSSSYSYRTKVVVTVYDASGRKIDSATKYS